MGWISNDNLHEGYLESVLVEGARSTTTSIDGPIVMLHDEAGNYTSKEVQRSDDEITAWQLRCDCTSEHSSRRVATWDGPTWQRAATAAIEDLENGLIYAASGDAAYLSERDDVEEMARARWLAEHVAPLEALDTIRASQAEIAAATQRLDQAVIYARASEQTWAKIGAAAGMSRQAAQERWGSATN